MRLLDDNPSIEDTLGFRPTANAIVETITNASRRPLTIGIFGGWGSGKTSLMQMVEGRVKEKGIKTVWFNAWKYSGKEVVWNALIQTILLAMKNDPDVHSRSERGSFKQRVLAVSQELAKYAAKVGTRFIPGGIVKESDVDDLWKALSSNVEDGGLFEFMNRFESEFQRLVDEYVDGSFIVIFIDDLDRCLPENAIEVMEALKLYLDKANCVFVIGVEPSIIETAIRIRYAASPNLSASKYLEKIVQVPIAVPRVRTQSGLELVASVVGDSILSGRQELSRLIQVGMDRNPRRIKRFANALSVALSAVPEPSLEDQLILAKVLVVQMRFPEFFRELTRDAGLMTRLQDKEEDGPWAEAGVSHLSHDVELRRFLRLTQRIPAPAARVRRWIRVAEAGGDVDDETA
jgi:predicted KAP-like P-loop ATPase